MNKIEKEVRNILNKLPCVSQGCNGTSAYSIAVENPYNGEPEESQEQCQFCYEIRYPFIKQATQKIVEIVNENKEFFDANTELNHKLIRENDKLKKEIEELIAYHKGLLEGMSKND